MKLRHLVTESLIFEIRKLTQAMLAEAITDYLSTAIAKLKAKKNSSLDQSEVDLDQLASIMAGMKVLGTKEYRQAMTKDDLGIDPNNAEDLYKVLSSIPKDGKNIPKLTHEVFSALKELAPKVFKTEREALNGLGSEDRDQTIAKISTFASKVNQAFSKTKTASTSKSDVAPAKSELEA